MKKFIELALVKCDYDCVVSNYGCWLIVGWFWRWTANGAQEAKAQSCCPKRRWGWGRRRYCWHRALFLALRSFLTFGKHNCVTPYRYVDRRRLWRLTFLWNQFNQNALRHEFVETKLTHFCSHVTKYIYLQLLESSLKEHFLCFAIKMYIINFPNTSVWFSSPRAMFIMVGYHLHLLLIKVTVNKLKKTWCYGLWAVYQRDLLTKLLYLKLIMENSEW